MSKMQLDAVLRLVDVSINPGVFKKISQATAGMPKNLRLSVQHMHSANRAAKGLNKTIQTTSNSMVGMNRVARQFLQRMAQFAVLLPTFATLNRAIQGSVRFLIDFESELAKIIRIDPTNLRDRMREISDAALDIAKEFGSTGDIVIGSIRIFKQAGDTIEEAIDKARVATLAATVTTLDLAGAQELLIAVNKQFASEGLSNAEILDKLVKVEDSAAVSAQDLAEALRTGGNALAFATKSFDDTLGLIAALREQTRKTGREIGTFGKTLSTRLLAAGEPRAAVEALGVSVENLDGSLRPMFQILGDLAIKFDALTESEQATTAKAVAGVRQFESFISTLKALKRANEVSVLSTNAQDTAQKQLSVTSETLEFRINQMVSAFQKLANTAGEAGLLDIFKDAVDFASEIAGALGSAVKFADKLGVAITPLLAVGGIKLGQKIFGAGGGGPIDGGQTGPASQVGQLGIAAANAAKQVSAFGASTAGMVRANQDGQRVVERTVAQQRASIAAIVGLSIAANIAGSAIKSFGDSLDNKKIGEAVSSIGGAVQAASSFALLGPTAALAAGSLTLLVSTVNQISDAYEEELKARKEISESMQQEAKFRTLLSSGEQLGAFDVIKDEFKNQLALTGKIDFRQAEQNIQKAFNESFSSLRGLDLTGMLGDPRLIAAIGNADESLVSLNRSLDNGERGTGLLEKGIQDLSAQIDVSASVTENFIGNLTALAGSIDRLNELEKVADLEVELIKQRTALAEVTKSEVALFESATVARRRELEQLQALPSAAEQMINGLISIARTNPESQLKQSKPQAEAFVNEIFAAFEDSSKGAGERLAKILAGDQLLDVQKDFAKKLVGALQQQKEEELEIAKAQSELSIAIAEREFDRQQALRQTAEQTSQVFDELKKSLVELGTGADATQGDLSALQNLSADEFRAILAGTSDLGENIRNAVEALAGDEVAQAEQAISQATQGAAVELEALQRQLMATEDALSDVKDGFNQSVGKSEVDLIREAGDLRAQITQRQGQLEIELAKLGVDRAQAMKEAEDEAAEKAKELRDALDDLARAEADVAKEAKSVNQAFEDFVASKISDFASADADAQSELKDAQQAVIESTGELADAYAELNQAILDFNDGMASAQVESNLLGVQIAQLKGNLSTFQGRLAALDGAFTSVLNDANISLQQRIDLERQLAEETLSFLQQAQAQITSAGLEVFGQTGQENQALQEGIQGLRFIADQLGGSFEKFLQIEPGDFNKLSNELLNLPVEFRQNILNALNTLPDTVSVGGFSVEELRTAIGQIGAGVAPEEGLPSVEELIEAETAQIEELRDLAIKDAELQLASVVAAQEQLELSKAQLEEAEIMKERAEENAIAVREAILEEKAVLDAANEQRQMLTEQVLAATNEAALEQIQSQAEKFAEQNAVFREIGDQIVGSIESLASVQAAALAAAAAVPAAYGGHIPSFAGGNLTRREIGGLIRAASIEKRHMPGGAGLAVANTSEAIIPTRHKGYIPNFQEGNLSEIGAGISAVKGVNETVVAAISRSVGEALADVNRQGNDEGTRQIVDSLGRVLDELENISASSASTASNTEIGGGEGGGGATARTAADLRVDINMNQRDTVQVTGLESLVGELEGAIRNAQEGQAGMAVQQLEGVVTEINQVLRERGLISSIGQPG